MLCRQRSSACLVPDEPLDACQRLIKDFAQARDCRAHGLQDSASMWPAATVSSHRVDAEISLA